MALPDPSCAGSFVNIREHLETLPVHGGDLAPPSMPYTPICSVLLGILSHARFPSTQLSGLVGLHVRDRV